MASDVCVERRRRRAFVWGCTLSLAFSFLPSSADAEELIQPPVCSADKNTAGKTPRGTDVCSVTPIGVDANGVEHHEVKIDLTANTAPIQVGGYKVITENYNGAYLPPIVEAMPGDVVAARLENLLEPRQPDSHGMAHETTPGENPTNLHYFHGGIVTPRNSRPGDDGGDPKNLGDNVYASLKNGKDASGSPNSFEFNVPIPGKGELDARVLEDSDPSGMIAHPPGLNWYHSHLHGISARQVGGGMSGLLSVGGAKANVGGKTPTDTQVLRKRTDVSYLMLRDLPILSETSPENAKGDAAAEWRHDLPTEKNPRANACALSITDIPKPEESDRKGFCWAESEPKSIWLFTINGLRYPTITIDPGRNRLLRIANLSANFTYTLTIVPKNGGEPFKFDLLSVDGVVPGNPLSSSTSEIPVEATPLTQLLLMPASRAEIYVRNDGEDAVSEREYVLRTEELHTSKVGPDGTWIGPGDDWPQIQLARIVFKARPPAAPQIAVALNTIRSEPTRFPTAAAEGVEPELPSGCVRDINQKVKEHRLVMFTVRGKGFGVSTQILRPINMNELGDPVEDFEEVGEKTSISPISFHEYLGEAGNVDWDGTETGNNHACVRLATGAGQLWQLFNGTTELHNFHIHQMKFRLAKEDDFKRYGIDPEKVKKADAKSLLALVEKEQGGAKDVWHDTIPVEPEARIFLIMSFVAKQQLGRFVYHCHILEHEDRGLMAPIEVID